MRITLAAALLGLALTGEAHAAPDPSSRIARFFQSVDTNHDGGITLAEWKAAGRGEKGFHRFDADRDNRMTLSELAAAVSARSGNR